MVLRLARVEAKFLHRNPHMSMCLQIVTPTPDKVHESQGTQHKDLLPHLKDQRGGVRTIPGLG